MRGARPGSSRILRALLSCLVATSLAAAPAARAQDAAAQARTLFEDGLKSYEAGQDADALEKLEASNRLLPSPNTQLLVGHALRRLGRRAEAVEAYQRVIADAAPRVGAGESRYQPALEEAGRLSAALRADLGELRVIVRGAARDTSLIVGTRAISASFDSATGALSADLWHEPGKVMLVTRGSTGGLRREVVVERGKRIEIVLELGSSRAAATTPPPATSTPDAPSESGPPPASLILGGVGVVGVVGFALFEGVALSIASDLEDCQPCAESRRGDADRGATFQGIAFVSLAVGIGALTTAGVVWAARGSSGSSARAAHPSLGGRARSVQRSGLGGKLPL